MSFVSALAELLIDASSPTWLALMPTITYYVWLVAILASIAFRYHRYQIQKLRNNEKIATSVEKEALLFPSMNVKKSTTSATETSLPELTSSQSLGPQPCSTGLTTRLLPFKNDKGEIEWVFSDDIVPGKELDAFKVMPMPLQPLLKNDVLKQLSSETTVDLPNDLSPVTSASSNNSLSGKRQELLVLQIHTPSSSSSEDHKDDDEDNSEEGGDEGGESEVFQCEHCSSSFKIRGYLTRHMKKHLSKKAYHCPFHDSTTAKTDLEGPYRCHPTGGFSRRDTYKSHLKARHFRYPRGTSTKDRNLSPGSCGMCGEWFQNAEIWTEIHIEGAECKCLPQGFKGKSRIKNKLKKQMARMEKEQRSHMMKNPGLGSFEKLDHQSPVFATPNSTAASMFGASTHDYSDSPTHSILSSTGPSTAASTGPYAGTPQTVEHLQCTKPHSLSNLVGHLLMDQERDHYQDYSDEYCLDTEQMCYPQMPVRSNTMMHHPEALYDNGALSNKMGQVMSQYSH